LDDEKKSEKIDFDLEKKAELQFFTNLSDKHNEPIELYYALGTSAFNWSISYTAILDFYEKELNFIGYFEIKNNSGVDIVNAETVLVQPRSKVTDRLSKKQIMSKYKPILSSNSNKSHSTASSNSNSNAFSSNAKKMKSNFNKLNVNANSKESEFELPILLNIEKKHEKTNCCFQCQSRSYKILTFSIFAKSLKWQN